MVVQSIPLVSDLQNQRRNLGVIFLATGLTVQGDAGGGIYFWEPASTVPADGFYSIQVTGVSVGRWIRIYAGSSIYNTDGALTSNRTVDQNGHSLTFQGTSSSTIFGATGQITAGSLSGYGTRMVVANPSGILSTQEILVGPSLRFQEKFTATAGQTVFTTVNTMTASLFDVYVNGVRLDDWSYTFAAHTITLNDGCALDDIVDIVGFSSLNISDTLPSQAGHAGQFLKTDGTNLSWASVQLPITLTTTGTSGPATFIGNVLNIPQYEAEGSYVTTSTTLTINGTTYDLSANRTWSVGTVTSVDMTVPTGLAISGNPINGSGTLALSYAYGYSIPTNVKQSNWDDAYTWVYNFPTQTGNNGKYLTTDGSTLSWGTINISGYVPTSRTLTINGTTYDLTANRTWSVGTVTSVQLSAGTGISLSGTNPITSSGTITVTNSAPDQIVTITAGENISVSGTYPNFTVSAVGETISSFLLMGA